MDTKWKKRKIIVSFAVFFLGVSLLILNGAIVAERLMLTQSWRKPGVLGLMNRDYQDTAGFRSYMQDMLEEFLSMASDEGLWGQGKECSDSYHEGIRRNKNLLYRVTRTDKQELYSNMDGISWDESQKKLPDGYNFWMTFDGKKITAQKDGQEISIYGDGYYDEDSQWYVPGYRNFTVDADWENIRITMLVAKDPVSYSHLGKQGYLQIGNSPYYLAQNVSRDYSQMRSVVIGLVVGTALFALSLSLWKEKRNADVQIARFMRSVWFEIRFFAFLVCAAVLFAWVGYEGFDVMFDDLVQEAAYAGEADEKDMQSAYVQEGDVSDADMFWQQRDMQAGTHGEWLEATATQDETGAFWTGWVLDTGRWRSIGTILLTNPRLLTGWFWLIYLVVLDIRKNRWGMLDGCICRILQRARTQSLRQPYALQQVRRFRLAAAAGIAAGAAQLAVTLLQGAGIASGAEAAAAQCLILAALVVVFYRCLSRVRAESEEIDLLAEHIRAVQSGDYTEKEKLSETSGLRPLSDSLSQIRQGMEQAVGEQLRSERMKVELVANVSHDLKTPLTSIISYLALLKQEEELPEHIQDYIRILDEKAERLNSIVKDVFAVSKAASGQLPVEIKELDFGKLLRQTLADMQEQIQASTMTVKTEIPTEAVLIQADGSRMYRVFQNLIQNALSYSLDGSRIFVELVKEGGFAVTNIKNISRQELRYGIDFTERFVRADESRTDGGAGLGLSIAKSFTEACGGRLTLETNADLFVVRVSFACSEAKPQQE